MQPAETGLGYLLLRFQPPVPDFARALPALSKDIDAGGNW